MSGPPTVLQFFRGLDRGALTAGSVSPSGPKVGTGSSGRTRAAGSTTGSERRSRRQRAARSSSPSTATTSGMAAAPETERTDRDDPGESTKLLRPELVLKTQIDASVGGAIFLSVR